MYKRQGLLVISVAGNILRIQPPLNIEHDLFRKAFAILDEAMADYEAGNIPDVCIRDSTYGSSSMTTVTTRMRKKMGPFLPEIYPFPFFGSRCV